MDALVVRQRLRGFRKTLRSKKLDTVIISKTENVRYLTGFTGHDSWVLVTGRAVVLITDSRYTEQAQGECAPGVRIVQRTGPMTKALAAELGRYSAIKQIGLEDTVSVATLKQIRKAIRPLQLSVTPMKNLVEQIRSIKNEQEIESIEQAARISWAALHILLEALETGITEEHAAAILEYEMRTRGATAGFETIICFGPNGSRNHHQPGHRKLRKQDQILIDFGARINGYTCDITRSFAWTKATAFYQKVWQTVRDSQQAAIAMIHDGAKVAKVDRAA